MLVDLKKQASKTDSGEVEYVKQGSRLIRSGVHAKLSHDEALLVFAFLEKTHKCVQTEQDHRGQEWEAQVCHHAGRFVMHVQNRSYELIFRDERLHEHARKQAQKIAPSEMIVAHDPSLPYADTNFLEVVKKHVKLRRIDSSTGELFKLKEGQARLVTSLLDDHRAECTYTEKDEKGYEWIAEACKQGNRYMLHGARASYDVIIPESMHQLILEKCMERARTLHSVYNPSYVFPDWVVQDFIGVMQTFGPKTKVYYSHPQLQEVKSLVATREPVNIGRGSLKYGITEYDKDAMRQYFGYETGSYRKGSPNIAIYCETPVTTTPLKNAEMSYAKFLRTATHLPRVKVINVIGYAFDSPDQADYQYFKVHEVFDSRYTADRRKEIFLSLLRDRYTEVWVRVMHAAHDNDCTCVVASGVGSSSFISTITPRIFPKGESSFLELVQEPAILRAQELCSMRGINVDVEKLPPFAIPTKLHEYDLNRCLFTNAWDPWSIVGNGNRADKSLDGWWGRQSAMSVLCWPITNPWMRNSDAWRYVPMLKFND